MSAQIVHGGGLDSAIARFGGEKRDWLDLSTGINPNPWPIPALDAMVWQRLPDSAAEEALHDAAHAAFAVGSGREVLAANGTQMLIEMLPRVLSSDHVAIMSPTYQEHELSWAKAGRHATRIGHDDALPLRANALVVVNPNNPDGHVHSIKRLEEMADDLALRHGWLIVDEAFCECDPSTSMAATDRENVIVLRSFGKFFGLAGVRLGFLVASPKIIMQVQHLLGPWSVSGPALAIGAAALRDKTWIEATRRDLPMRSQRLQDVLKGAGFQVEGSNALFVLAKHEKAQEIHQRLCEAHILTRRFPEYPQWLRFGLCADDAGFERLENTLKTAVQA